MRHLLPFLFAVILPNTASAGACDYRPSQLLGRSGADTAIGAGAAVAATGTAMSAAGFYTLTHSVTGLTMLGSTAAGTSAAGTVGIIAGTGGAVGTVGAVLLAPVTIVAGVVTAVGVGGYEVTCFFSDERLTDFEGVKGLMLSMAAVSDPKYFQYVVMGPFQENEWIALGDGNGNFQSYRVTNLYIVNDVLMHRDLLRNTVIGTISFVPSDG